MPGFFNSLVENSMIERWSDILDWIFDDEKFSDSKGWTKTKKARFAKRTNKLEKLKKENYIHSSAKKLVLPESYYDKTKEDIIIIISGSRKSEDLVRHIRNGIAHGRTRCKRVNGEPYIEIYDYNAGNKPTAYIYMPLDYIQQIYKMYVSVQNSKVEGKSRKSKKAA